MTDTAIQTRKYFDYNAVPERETRAFLRKRAEHGKAILKRTAQGIWEMGALLSEVKAMLPHGDFAQWVDAEFDLSDRTARHFMAVHEAFKSEIISDLPVSPTILYALSAPSVDEETRAEAIEEIRAGNLRTVAQAKAFVAPKAEPEPQILEAEVVSEEDAEEAAMSVSGEPDPNIVPPLAERVAKAEVLHDSLSEVREQRTAEAQESAQSGADLPFEEWKRSLAIWRVLSKLGGRAILLERGLRDWQTIEKPLGTFQHHVARCESHKALDRSPLSQVLGQVHALKHPRFWQVCPPCRGGGCERCGECGYCFSGGIAPERVENGEVQL